MPDYSAEIHDPSCGEGETMPVASLTAEFALKTLARVAADAMLDRRPVTVQMLAPYDRPKGWPLPMKREANGQPMNYRPLAILDYVEYALAERDRARLAPADCSDLV